MTLKYPTAPHTNPKQVYAQTRKDVAEAKAKKKLRKANKAKRKQRNK